MLHCMLSSRALDDEQPAMEHPCIVACITYHEGRVFNNMINSTGATCRAGYAYPPGGHASVFVVVCVAQFIIFMLFF